MGKYYEEEVDIDDSWIWGWDNFGIREIKMEEYAENWALDLIDVEWEETNEL